MTLPCCAALSRTPLNCHPGIKKSRSRSGLWSNGIRPCQYNHGTEFLSNLPVQTQKEFRIVYDELAFANLRNFNKNLLEFEPCISGGVLTDQVKEDLELGMSFMNKKDQDKVAVKFQGLGYKPGQRVSADGNCGFASVAIMTGDSPQRVRDKARQAALDMQDYMDYNDIRRINGDPAYRLRIQKAVNSFREKAGLEDLPTPGERAEIVHKDPTTIDFSKVKPLQPYDFWLHFEDMQFLAVAYGRPVFPLGENDEGDQYFGKYITASGELKYTFEEGFYNEGMAELRQPQPEPLVLVNMGTFGFRHWMPMVPTPLPAAISQALPSQSRTKDEMLTSLKQDRFEQRQYLDSLMENPELIPAGQSLLPRAPSPKYDESLGENSLGQTGSVYDLHRQRLDALDGDPLMSIQLAAVGPERGKYQHLTSLPSDDDYDLHQSLTSLKIQQAPVEVLPPPDAGKTPGFYNFGMRTCFCNAGLKQQILGMSMADVRALKDRAYELRRNHPGVYNHTFMTRDYGERSHVRDGGKRAELMLRFAELG